ncbi:MAG TPA: GGDEF domain-containing protein [Pseudolabrys sp.]
MADPADNPPEASAALLAEIERLSAELLEAKWQIAELEARADVDPLTDILNRRGFDRELARSLAYVKRYGGRAALVLIDLDGFKAINDSHGHAAGDALLKAVAARLVASVRASDIVARLGGDEFATLLWNLDEAQAVAKSRDLEAMISAVRVAGPDVGVFGVEALAVGASAGAVMLDGNSTPGEITGAADKTMYVRKRERRE